MQDVQSVDDQVTRILPLARSYGVSAYDAAYLELSIRHGAPLVSLDGKLRKAARKAGVEIFL
jgi:predicted nucleic acid-binding protein